MPDNVRDEIVGAYPLGRVGEVEDVAATALFLATKDSTSSPDRRYAPPAAMSWFNGRHHPAQDLRRHNKGSTK